MTRQNQKFEDQSFLAGIHLHSKVFIMTRLAKIEEAVRQLASEDLAQFREWFQEFDANAWDQQCEEDALSGKLDALGMEALENLEAGRCTDI